MTEEKSFDCTKFCKMTTEIRNSKFCTKESKIIDGKVHFGCTKKLSLEPEPVQMFYKCLLWDMGQKESCNTCMLSCTNNKNGKFKEAVKKKERLHKLMKSLEPNMVMYGITAQEIEKISDKYVNSEDNEASNEAIKAAEVAQKSLYAALNGKNIDISFLGLYAQHSSKRIKKLADKAKRKSKKK